MGDSADGYPGVRGWGPKSAAALLSRYGHLANVPLDALESHGAESLRAGWDQALLFLRLATLRTDAHLFDSVNALEWRGPRPDVIPLARRIGAEALVQRAEKAAAKA
ncbi:MAG TPA: 5'-3' exonuclease H3TH domain-containing protein [Spirochaetia bacterium]|nr:5'-3' exonuclease H3TH domain-containing protein [Spirochaetia bacterium]